MRLLKIFKKWISLYGVCVLGMSICLVIILNSKKQVKELKQEFDNKIDTLGVPDIKLVDTVDTWFNKHRVYKYESIDTMVADYDHGKELIIYFKYTN